MARNRGHDAKSTPVVKLGDIMAEEFYAKPPFELKKVRNLVLTGGGVKGVYLLPALRKLNILPQIENIAATSIGTFVALGLGIGLSIDFLQNNLMETMKQGGLLKLLDTTNPCNPNDSPLKKIYDALHNLYQYGGLYLGDQIVAEAIKLLESDQNQLPPELRNKKLTFAQLHDLKVAPQPIGHFIDLFFTAWDKKKNPHGVLMSWKADEFKDTPIVEAVRASMSIPFFYRPAGGKFWDGFLYMNLPIPVFDYEDKDFLFEGEKLWRGKNLQTLAIAFPQLKKSKLTDEIDKPKYPLLSQFYFYLQTFAQYSFYLRTLANTIPREEKSQPAVRAAKPKSSLLQFSLLSRAKKAIYTAVFYEEEIWRKRGDDFRTFFMKTEALGFLEFRLKPQKASIVIEDSEKQTDAYILQHSR